jgi:hypothetical protein
MPEFGYEYEIYREAAERYNSKQRNGGRVSHGEELNVLTLEEFVTVLEFRERELFRLVEKGRSRGTLGDFEKANEWHWPEEWGRLGWNCPIIRDRLCLFEAEQELVQTRAALERHRSRLLVSR